MDNKGWAIKRRNGGIDGNDAIMDDETLWGAGWVEVVPADQLRQALAILRRELLASAAALDAGKNPLEVASQMRYTVRHFGER